MASRALGWIACSLLLALLAAPTAPAQGPDTVTPPPMGPFRFVVGFHELPSLQAGDLFFGAEVLRVNSAIHFAVVLAPSETWGELDFSGDPNVRYVAPDPILPLLADVDVRDVLPAPGAGDPPEANFVPDDPGFTQMYGPQQVEVDRAWDVTRGSFSANVCILDTGVRNTHEELADRWLGGYDFVNDDIFPQDDHGHGTHVAGTAAARIDNELGITGMGNVGIFGVKVLGAGGSGTWSDVADGITWCADNTPPRTVLSLSLSGSAGAVVLEDAVNYAYTTKGKLVVAAAGNGGPCVDCVRYPAKYANAIAVTCTTSTEAFCSFSREGPEAEISAPGDAILSSCYEGDSSYCTKSGTSMSTPHVSGVAALVWSQKTTLTNVQLRQCLRDTAVDRGAAGFDNEFGHGRLNAAAAMDADCTGGLAVAVLREDFESGAPGWAAAGLWHVTVRRANSPTHSAWYGQEATVNYNTGATNSGALTSPPFAVPEGATLTFRSFHQTEAGLVFDKKLVQVSTDCGTTWATVAQLNDAQLVWNSESVGLAAYAGQSVRLRFFFDTVDAVANNFEGWYVDDVRVYGTPTPQALQEDFEPAGDCWTYEGLWHLTTDRSNSPTHSAWYGQEATGDYDTGVANTGRLTSPVFAAPHCAVLTFQSFHETEAGLAYDQKLVEASKDGTNWETLLHVNDPQLVWKEETVDLSAFGGMAIQLRFRFNTLDDIANGFEGWYVDDVRVTVPLGMDEDFEAGAPCWSARGLWHMTEARSSSATHSLWYGQEDTGDYDTGAANAGALTSEQFLVPAGAATLTFRSFHLTELGLAKDQKLVQVDDGGGWDTVLQVNGLPLLWNQETVDLSAYAGQVVQLRFLFDTVDADLNSFEGWYVDDVLVSA